MQQGKQKNRGAVYILISAVLLSLGGLLIKRIPWSAMAVNGGRNLFAAVVTYGYLRITHQKLRCNLPVLACGACLCANSVLYTLAARHTTAANAIVLEYTSPVFVILYMALFFHQKPRRIDLGACGVVFCGVACFFVESLSGGGMTGNLLAVGAAATYAVVFLVNLIDGCDSFSGFFWSQIFSAAVGLPWIVVEPNKSVASWLAVAFMGVVQIGVAYLFMSKGLATTGPIMANVLCMCEPVLNPVWVALFYGEHIGKLSLVGICIVLVGLLVYNTLNGRMAASDKAQPQ